MLCFPFLIWVFYPTILYIAAGLYSHLVCSHTCACRSCSSLGFSAPVLWLSTASSSSGPSSSCCGGASLSGLSSTSELGAAGHTDSFFCSRHLSRTWHTERQKKSSGPIQRSLLQPSAHNGVDTLLVWECKNLKFSMSIQLRKQTCCCMVYVCRRVCASVWTTSA